MKGQSFAGLALLRESMRKIRPNNEDKKDKKEEAAVLPLALPVPSPASRPNKRVRRMRREPREEDGTVWY